MSMLSAARSPAHPADPPGDIPFTSADFARIAALAHREYGLNLQEGKKDLVYSRLVKRLRKTGCPSFSSYFDMLENDPHNPERVELISALTTNVTHFFREDHHFRYLAEALRPRLDQLRAGQRLRIWSAGCSAGQEPYCMAATLCDLLPEAPRANIRILATDVDTAILAKARAAQYPFEEAKGVPDQLRGLMFDPAPQAENQPLQITQRLRGMVHFAELNLMADWPIRGPFDAIFCRNVAIYFDKPTQARLWQRFATLLAPGGLLCIGHSERLSGPATELLANAGITAYRRNTAASAFDPAQKGPAP